MWADDQRWERDWWGNCTNTLSEELKQLSYFKRLGLEETKNSKWRFAFDLGGKTILDIGGGPSSFLLRCVNFHGTVLDPMILPCWVEKRYVAADIQHMRYRGEDVSNLEVDEVWIYNVLQHVENPQKIIENARKMGKVIRLFDWIEAGVHPGHPHNLTVEQLDSWLDAKGTVEDINENDAFGKCYYGIFPQKGVIQ